MGLKESKRRRESNRKTGLTSPKRPLILGGHFYVPLECKASILCMIRSAH